MRRPPAGACEGGSLELPLAAQNKQTNVFSVGGEAYELASDAELLARASLDQLVPTAPAPASWSSLSAAPRDNGRGRRVRVRRRATQARAAFRAPRLLPPLGLQDRVWP